ncbi:PREDICTED: transmembrane protein 70 homolog, mitochondrial [Ceratosolen solmsi marchali]|uniref:Transmembrane protein 70 homolog, mitochondrial n=1 Tax=Ceratosolen solmsi marchali TaxID=326594 RepID=A0AAJ6YL72_9HYME|nr:PREDICTED: transmembrane protein 70 homolog, mitochondrial [Ceratosolen solmsi marchali]
MESDERQTIYKATLAQHIRNIKCLSLFTSLLGIVSQPFIYVKVLSGTTAPSVSLSICGILCIFTFGSPILLHLITKTYIVNIDYIPKNDKYIATVYNFFAMKRKIEFTPADITIPTVLGIFTTCAIKQANVFIDANQFLDQNHYIKIMGYDKPFKLMDDNHDKKE